MTVFEVTKEMIVRLEDEQLRQLLCRLLEAEARARSIPLSAIAVGGNQTAGDGGVDGSIAWNGPPNPEGWLPQRMIYFQSKAEVMGPAKLTKEMRPGGVVRSIFTELAAVRGAYIVFSSDDPSKSSRDARLTAMRAALADVAGSDQIALDFYGADKIARWSNEHLGVALWLLEETGRPLAGWRRYGAWSAPDNPGQLYLVDDTARATIHDRELPMRDAVAAMREILARPGGVVRLIGLSGMGKTRLAEALFDDRLEAGAALPKERAVYGDTGLDLSVSAALMAEQIAVAGIEAVMVVDNCTQRTHDQLAEIVRRGNSRVSLLTIDYDVLSEQPAGTLVTLGCNSEEILEGVLKQRFPKLSNTEHRHLAEFSGGNARIALKIAEAGGEDIDLSKLKDSQLLERLFQGGRQERDSRMLDCAEAASLVHAFYVADGDGHVVEYPVLASLADINPQRFFRAIATFLDWGVVQQRGPQRAVMPPPLANMLAGPCIRRSDPDTLVATFSGGPVRLFASFARRIGQLHDERAAIAIAERFFAAGGPLGHPVEFDPLMHRAFIQAAPAAPEAALGAIERALASGDRDRLLVPNEHRRDLCQLLVHLAHEQRLFGRAIDVLIDFTLADRDTRDEFKARPHLLERFWPILSLTLADQDTRLLRIDRMLSNPDDRVRALGVEALDHMLDANHFSSSLSLEFGAKARLKEWRPNNGAGYRPWFDAAYDRLVMIAKGEHADTGRAREVIAEHFREHYDSSIDDKTLDAMRAVRGAGYWERGWRAINDTLHLMRSRPAPENPAAVNKLEALVALERDFRPKSLDDFFVTFVLGEPWRHWHPNGNDRKMLRNASTLSRAVGRVMMRRNVPLAPYLSRAAVAHGANSVWSFLAGLARSANDLDELWDMSYELFAVTDHGHPGQLGGLLEGARFRHRDWVERKLDAIVTDPTLGEHLITLQHAVPLDAAAVGRFSTALSRGLISVDRFSQLMAGSVTKPLPGTVLAQFLRELFAHQDGLVPAAQILHMRLFGDRSDKMLIDPALVEVGREMLDDARIYTHEFRQHDHDITEIAKVVFMAGDNSELARAICVAMRENAGNNYVSDREFRELAALIMTRYPLIVYEEIVEKSANMHLIERFFGELADDDDDKMPESETSLETLLEWVAQDPQARALKVGHVVRYTVKDGDSGELRWSALALALIDIAVDPGAVLRVFENRFFTGAGWGPFSLRFVRRRPLVAAMLQSSHPRARAWAREAGPRIEESIRQWDEMDRDRDSRFE
ncbi:MULTISPECIES: hypothetical protein [unclassified Mesorhizobium]|uniref:hypothetical protein n=2 Tax=Mesorhizobium TaxID=68287 RepID=UPI000FDA3ECE|nr:MULTISPECIES: hypothetical protein [unclassified Mesorhizobium]TGQ04886.1 hypothetical protein EN862_031885 [Mesorhizobium sp. M2E.F.Ca.ET.219.01.1.1]TGT65405.1 hypothetical protein EN809_031615 [Mesorhizobium sp. M2E.F.Ca.ET.166.01.1.1]TGV97451.1 hypothetical protein EN797_031625 [Mesorhizobium sp. M2E.F.Ca.ET.154.01.1.1]